MPKGLRTSAAMALLAEPDRALRVLMRQTLEFAGYQVFESENVLQLEVGLRIRDVVLANRVLFVLAIGMVSQCEPSVRATNRNRVAISLSQAHVILTCEPGRRPALPRPELGPCLVAGVLEKPLELLELRQLALQCRFFPLAPAVR